MPSALAEICRQCAECCKKHPFVELSKNDIEALEQATGLHHFVFTNRKGKAVEEYFLSFQENGDCFFLSENNAKYSCGVYEARPQVCRDYPLKPDREKSVVACPETHP